MLATPLDRFVDERRVLLYARTALVLFVLIGAAWLFVAWDGDDPMGKPFGYDFITFWSAAKLALEGRAEAAFDLVQIFAAQREAVPQSQSVFLWHYPPTFDLLVAPLALLPYRLAYFVFELATLPLYLLLIRRISDHRAALLLALAFPAVFINAFHGQNAFLNTAVFGFGLLLVERRPVVAGVLIGALAYKPHLALLVPLLLAAGGYWRTFVAAAATLILFCGLATAVFGLDYWRAFFDNAAVLRVILEQGFLPWHKMPTLFAAASLLGAPAPLAYALHALGAIAAAALATLAWHRPGPLDLKVALATTATLVISPYSFDYDLVMLAIPVAILADRAVRSGDRRGAAVLMLVAVMPLVCPSIAQYTHVQLMPLGIAALFVGCRQALAAARPADPVRAVASPAAA
jgi:hypothetical protein